MQYWDEVLFPDMLNVIRGECYLTMTDAQIADELISLAKRAVNTFKFPKISLEYSAFEVSASDISGLSCVYDNQVLVMSGDVYFAAKSTSGYNTFNASSNEEFMPDSTNAEMFTIAFKNGEWDKFFIYYHSEQALATSYGKDNIFVLDDNIERPWIFINGEMTNTYPGTASTNFVPVTRRIECDKSAKRFAPYKLIADDSQYFRAVFSNFQYFEFIRWIDANTGNKTVQRNFEFMCRFNALTLAEKTKFFATTEYRTVLDWGFTFDHNIPTMPTTTRYCFKNNITDKEAAVIIAWMKYYWADLMVSNADNFNNLYFDSNINAFSPGNLLHNYKETCNMYRDQAKQLENEYYRVDAGKPTLGSITED